MSSGRIGALTARAPYNLAGNPGAVRNLRNARTVRDADSDSHHAAPDRPPMTLDADDIEAVAARVVELLVEQTGVPGRYVDAATVARTLGVDRDWVYSRARQLGAVRLGDGPKARLRFDIERVRAALAEAAPDELPPPDEPPRRRRGRPRRPAGSVGVPLIQGRSSR